MRWSTPEEAVRQALMRYCRGADRLDREEVLAAFWPDARVELGAIYAGPPAGFADVAMGFMGMFAATRHEVSSVVLAHDGGGIAYEAYVRAWHLTREGRELVVLGRYVGRAAERDGVWRLLEHGEIMDWGEERALDSAWFDANAELPKGRRDREDPSYRYV